jgi:hypothetical protein
MLRSLHVDSVIVHLRRMQCRDYHANACTDCMQHADAAFRLEYCTPYSSGSGSVVRACGQCFASKYTQTSAQATRCDVENPMGDAIFHPKLDNTSPSKHQKCVHSLASDICRVCFQCSRICQIVIHHRRFLHRPPT